MILKKIVEHKRKEVKIRKESTPFSDLESSIWFNRNTISISEALKKTDASGIISEFKKQSPSKGIINDSANIKKITKGYQSAGASAVSVLTDQHFFGGNLADLSEAREVLDIPILRKDFVIDEYQIYEAKAYGADFILLIAEVLEKEEIESFTKTAHNLGLEVLLELHSAIQLPKISEGLNLVGVNNRNLDTFEVDINTSIKLFEQISDEFIRISESGISKVKTIDKLRKVGFEGFLIGECFMKTDNPVKKAKKFINELNISVI